jgi:hypothetical protein
MRPAKWSVLGLSLAVSVIAQDLIRNPAKPLASEPSRVLKLETVFEIRDDSGDFFFKYPYRFDVDPKGCLYVLDQDQLLKFDPGGKFLFNLYRKGQGPGEIGSNFQMVSFFAQDDSVTVFDGRNKIMRFDGAGKLVEEIRQSAGDFFELMGPAEKGFYMRGQTSAPWGGGAGFKDIETSTSLVSPDGRSAEKIAGFTSRIYQGSNFGMDWDNYLQVFDRSNRALYVSHTCEYKVVRADLARRRIVASFTRAYRRVPFVVKDHEKDFYARNNPPKKDFENDIAGLFVCNGNIWVKTSTSDEIKGSLFDVFDPRGRFVDSFFLPKGLTLALADGPFAYVLEKKEDESIVLRKCRMLDGPGS